MIEGLVHAQVIDSTGIEKDIDYLERHGRGKEALQLLAERDVVQESKCHNQIYASVAGSLLWRCFNCADPGYGNNYWYTGGFPTWTGHYFSILYLSTKDSTPAYGDNEYFSTNWDSCNSDGNKPSGWISVATHKHLSEEIETHTCYSEALSTGRRSIYRTQKFLWTPSSFTSSNIRSAEWYVRATENQQYDYREHNNTYNWRWTARVRFKDTNGVNIVLNKTSNQSLLFEYTIRFTTL
jgi:hypothetical protein